MHCNGQFFPQSVFPQGKNGPAHSFPLGNTDCGKFLPVTPACKELNIEFEIYKDTGNYFVHPLWLPICALHRFYFTCMHLICALHSFS